MSDSMCCDACGAPFIIGDVRKVDLDLIVGNGDFHICEDCENAIGGSLGGVGSDNIDLFLADMSVIFNIHTEEGHDATLKDLVSLAKVWQRIGFNAKRNG